MRNVISIDLEQWFHRPIFRNCASLAERNDKQHITKATENILRVLKKHNKQTTFFVVAEIAEQAPEIIEEISNEGHELAFHGYSHIPLHELSREEFEREVREGLRVLRHLVNEKPKGFRAPVFSLNQKTSWALSVLSRYGFEYDSSVCPTITPIYGNLNAPSYPYYPSMQNPAIEDGNQKRIVEFPVLTGKVGFFRIPACGGFFLRLFGVEFTLRAVRHMNKMGYPAMVYVHPWELYDAPKRPVPGLKSIYAYYRIPVLRQFKHMVKNVEISRADLVLENG